MDYAYTRGKNLYYYHDCQECGQLITAQRHRSPSVCPDCRKRRHGHAAGVKAGGQCSRAYNAWRNMKARCQTPQHPSYPNYGGRGIFVCAQWQTFEGFYEDMGDPPEGLSLDRIDNDGGYEPSNCRWATWSEQMRNRRVA